MGDRRPQVTPADVGRGGPGGAPRILVAGIGNIFLSDDGFGPEVVRRLPPGGLGGGSRVVDYGIRGMHLAYDLLDGWDALVLVDAVPDRGCPGAVSVLELDPAGAVDPAGAAEPADDGVRAAGVDAHSMDPGAMLASLQALGGTVPRVLLVGCQAAAVGEGIGLTPLVAAAVDEAAARVTGLVEELTSAGVG